MATLSTTDHIASVSLTEADRDPEGFAEELGRSFEEYGFAIIADHGIPEELIHRAEEKAKAFFALPDEVKRSYHIPGGGGARGYTPFGIETAKGATGARPQGILARRPRAAGGPPLPRAHARQCLAGGGGELPATPSSSCTTTFDRTGLKILRGDRPLPRDRRGLFRRHGARRQFGAAAAPLSADRGRARKPYPRRRA